MSKPNVQLRAAIEILKQKCRRKTKRRKTLIALYGEGSDDLDENTKVLRAAVNWKKATNPYVSSTPVLYSHLATDLQIIRMKLEKYKIKLNSGNSVTVSPYVKFRRAARAVKALVQVCRVCKDLVLESIMREEWYDMVDMALKRDEGLNVIRKQRSRPFTAYVANEKEQCLDEITFDASQFSREHRADYLLTESVQAALSTKAGKRTRQQIAELVRYLKIVSPDFNSHPADSQRRLAQCMWYDRYEKNRVITKEGTTADAVYFLLSGTLMEKTEGKDPKDINAGEKFGESELICACARRSTVVTKSPVDLLTIHRLDYRSIINLSDDTDDPTYLDICKYDVVWRHFPLFKLAENSGVWTVLSYKFGRLIAKDSNNLEWIYIIRKGEARVIKTLTTSVVNLDTQKKRVQNQLNAKSEFFLANKLISFEAEAEYIKSAYCPNEYKPRVIRSAAPGQGRSRLSSRQSSCYSSLERRHTGDFTPRRQNCSFEDERQSLPELLHRKQARNRSNFEDELPSTESVNYSIINKTKSANGIHSRLKDTSRETSVKLPNLGSRPQTCTNRESYIKIPSFVQLETLRAGQCFGFRSCLNPREQGPSASLVSAGCEVLQVNKKFFTNFADDAVMGLIKVKYKPYPSEEELIDRMYSNVQWEQYKQDTVIDHFKGRGKDKTPYTSTFVKAN